MMKRNKILLAEQLRSKLTGKCVTAIVSEAFVNALPLNSEEVVEQLADFSKYSSDVISTMHPETLLANALESTRDDLAAHQYLLNLSNNIKEVVKSATKRIVLESDNSVLSNPDLVEQAKLDEDEVKKLVEASKKSGTAAVSKIIHDKVVKTLKDEKEAYEEEEKIKTEIREVISDKPDEEEDGSSTEAPQGNPMETPADAALDEIKKEEAEDNGDEPTEVEEAYYQQILAPTDARHHVSFFSKLQDICMEAISYSSESYEGEVPFDTMTQVTLESTFPYFDTSKRSLVDDIKAMKIVTESIGDMATASPEEKAEKIHKISKTAFICSIAILTMLETLKTMQLAKPEFKDVKNFVDTPTDVKNLDKIDLAKIHAKVGDAAKEIEKAAALGSVSTVELMTAKESLEEAKNELEDLPVKPDEAEKKAEIINDINNAIAVANNATDPKASDLDSKLMDSFTAKKKETNMVQLEHGIKVVAEKMGVQKVVIEVSNSAKVEDEKYTVRIVGVDSNYLPVTYYYISIFSHPLFGKTLGEIITDTAKYIILGTKPVEIRYTDENYSVPLVEK